MKRSLEDYERAQHLCSDLGETLVTTLDSLRQYVVETDQTIVNEFQSWTDTLLDKVQGLIKAPNEGAFCDVRTSIRGGLRDYHDRAGRYIHELRVSVDQTTTALRDLLATMQSGDSDAEADLKAEIARLESLQSEPTLNALRAGLGRSVASLAGCMAQLRQEKDSVIVLLRDEIRTLQNSLSDAQRIGTSMLATGFCSRQEFEEVVMREIGAGRTATILRVTLSNLANLATWYEEHVIEQLLTAFYKRARGALPGNATIGRWQGNVFCVLLRSDASDAFATALVRKCCGNYVCMDGAEARTLYLQMGAQIVVCADADAVGRELGRNR